MAEEKKEKWLNYLSATTILIAVCATLSTFKGGGFATKAMLSQSKASDQWAFFQAKSIKADLFEMQKVTLQIELNNEAVKINHDEIQKQIDNCQKKTEKYTKEKEDISKEAKNFESQRDEAKKHSEAFGMAVIFLQISILLSSIAALIKKKPIWYISMAIGIVGIISFVNGFFVFL